MKKFLLSPFKTNADLASFMRTRSHLQTVQARRAAIRIAVIDDQPFLPQTNLQSYGYTVTPIGDLKSIPEVRDFHIVLCDVMGVGRHFDAKTQGATLISEIKKTYPEKVVIAYTGGAMNDPAVRSARERADMLIRKDADGEEWTTKLDGISQQAVDPHIMWQKIRSRFVELDVDTKDILLLEDAYVRSVLHGGLLSDLDSVASNLNVNTDVRAIIQGLASSAIYAAITG